LGLYFLIRHRGFIAGGVIIVKTKGFLLIASALLTALALVVSNCARPSSESGALEIGRPAPTFTLADLNGKKVSLDQFKGKIVMLDFWATWCNPCRATMPLLENLQKEYVNTMVLLAINLEESGDEVRDFVRTENLHAQVLLDTEGAVGQKYGAAEIPMQVLIDKQGIVRDVMIGFNSTLVSRLRTEIAKLQ
jgi:thiol-disulfide isomerase/thioredoxin